MMVNLTTNEILNLDSNHTYPLSKIGDYFFKVDIAKGFDGNVMAMLGPNSYQSGAGALNMATQLNSGNSEKTLKNLMQFNSNQIIYYLFCRDCGNGKMSP